MPYNGELKKAIEVWKLYKKIVGLEGEELLSLRQEGIDDKEIQAFLDGQKEERERKREEFNREHMK